MKRVEDSRRTRHRDGRCCDGDLGTWACVGLCYNCYWVRRVGVKLTNLLVCLVRVVDNRHHRCLAAVNCNIHHNNINSTASIPRPPGQAGTRRMSDRTGFCCNKRDGGGGTDNWKTKTCQAPVRSSPLALHCSVILQARCPSHHPTVSKQWRLTTVSRELHNILLMSQYKNQNDTQ